MKEKGKIEKIDPVNNAHKEALEAVKRMSLGFAEPEVKQALYTEVFKNTVGEDYKGEIKVPEDL